MILIILFFYINTFNYSKNNNIYNTNKIIFNFNTFNYNKIIIFVILILLIIIKKKIFIR
jgi:uncharacterized protein YccT (UPF0319 family)